jgi:hypothetical protein
VTAATLTARPMRQAFVGRVMVHATASQQMKAGFVVRWRGEALCGTEAALTEPVLFAAPPITCQSCATIAAAEGVEITGGQL